MSKKKNGDLAEELLNDLMSDSDEINVEDSAYEMSVPDDSNNEGYDATVRISTESTESTAGNSIFKSPPPSYAQGDDEATKNLTSVEVNSQDGERLSEKVKTSVGRFFSSKNQVASNPTEASLAQSESLRIAQDRILELESLVNDLRNENEQLLAAGETLQHRAEKYMTENEKLHKSVRDQKEYFEAERGILEDAILIKDRDAEQSQVKLDELQARLSANMQKIRIRERELENRLELVKMESSALMQNKNEIILDLKKSIDQLNVELDNYRLKGQELNKQLDDKQEALRRTVKTLRLALTMLEGSEGFAGLKKAN